MTARPPVPYVTAWTGEDRRTAPVVVCRANDRGIGYPHENPQERDTMGVLWARRPLRQGHGRPRYGHVHPQRQRRAMHRLLCQVCAAPAYEDEHGTLFLLEDHRDVPGWPEEEVTAHPPLCLQCAAMSPEWCPHLRRTGAVAVQVQHPDIDGVHGLMYRREGRLAVPDKAVTVPYDDPAVRWVLAAHLTRVLRGCTIVQPEEIAERLST
ncbi:hypothetical protein [Streptomyces phytophilus]|uniref:hypothetical protein n=1 Tax=Streptomyces phytophilus TaxID=722715 RepID=UPI0015F1041D|nr:hypothetical protein [Streptomyces phytophilus]